MRVFDDYAYYYDAFYGDKDYVSEANIIDSLIKQYTDATFAPVSVGRN